MLFTTHLKVLKSEALVEGYGKKNCLNLMRYNTLGEKTCSTKKKSQ